MSEERKWSAKEAAKAGQKFRREARQIFSQYQKDLTGKLDEVRLIIRPRPRLIPRKVWLWCTNLFVDLNNANKALIFESPSDYLTRKHNEAVAQAPKKDTPQEFGDTDDTDEWEESDEIGDLIEKDTVTGSVKKGLEYQVSKPDQYGGGGSGGGYPHPHP